jgi:hypothetical protein
MRIAEWLVVHIHVVVAFCSAEISDPLWLAAILKNRSVRSFGD